MVVYNARGRVLWINSAFTDTFGWSCEELLGRRIDYVPEEYLEQTKETLEKAFRGELVSPFDTKRLTKDGRVLDIHISSALFRDEYGRPAGHIVTLRDVTERKKAEEALRLEREQLLSIFDSINAVISVADVQTYEILFTNRFTRNLYGKELIGGLCYKEIHGLDSPCSHCPKGKALSLKGEPYHWDYHNPTTNRDYLATDRIIKWTDGRDAKFHLGIDVTERKRLETEKENLQAQLVRAQRMKAISTLAGGVAHDFNNLLHVIQGYSEMLLLESDETDPSYADIQKIISAARTGANMVQRLLAFAKQAETRPVPLDLNRRIRNIEKIWAGTFPRTIRVEFQLADDLARINADPDQVDQILMNLAKNAQEAMERSGTLTVATANVSADREFCSLRLGLCPGDYVLLTISDTGKGTDKQTRDRMFDPFFTTKGWASNRGTGLGLPVVQGIVEQHGGFIECFSEVGKGTTFNVYLPRLADDSAIGRSEPGLGPVDNIETILLVDDEDLVRELGARILTKSGYRVLTAGNGREALDLYRQHHSEIALVILDLIMPEMSGAECLNELAKINPEVRVFISSGHSDADDPRKINHSSVRMIVLKPYEMKQFLEAVRVVLDEQ